MDFEPSNPAMPASNRRYDAYSHEALVAEVAEGNDPEAAGGLAGQWAGLGDRLRDARDQLTAIANASDEHWHGTAGEALRASLRSAAAWSDEASGVTAEVAGSVGRQAEVAARARADMPDPVGYDPASMISGAMRSGDLLAIAGLSDALEERRAAAAAAKAKAVDVVTTRDTGLYAAVPGAAFTPPSGPSAG
ncbi:PE-PGRS family protein [Amycolatopsis sp. CA-230715]|uniref:PE-PGRS family protein n=1 Tax=Amycolatopsis sp. CA-230715 TaxID=2745196 RepID=UPI001C338F43|nr:PE-PGRS family protein [Amycolatopsis sp. CA-230715]QWF77028.1 hypothetical protein HUW46_00408 [Amycolatopsis sp. CA-230715]